MWQRQAIDGDEVAQTKQQRKEKTHKMMFEDATDVTDYE